MRTRNIEIAGGGIAGLSLAIALRQRDVAVNLYEAGSYPRHRLCGEFINGVSDETLCSLGVKKLFHDAKIHRSMSWWVMDEIIAERDLPKPVTAMSRWTMDERMRKTFEEMGGVLHQRSRMSSEPREGLVWAAGRRFEKDSSWLGLKVHYQGVDLEHGLEMHLGDKGYIGLTPVEDGRVNVCGLFERRAEIGGKGSERLGNYLRACGLDLLADRLSEGEADESSLTGVSGIVFGSQQRADGLLALGDAERMTPPFTGNGMSMAFEAAEAAVQPLVEYANASTSWAETQRTIDRELSHLFKRRVAVARGLHRVILNTRGQELLAAVAKPGLLPFGFLNRILT